MIVPDTIDCEQQSDEEILERLQRDGGYDRGAAEHVLAILRGDVPHGYVTD